MPLVARLYTPEMMGVISIYLSFHNFWSTVLSCRYESALLVAVDESEAYYIFYLGLAIVVSLAILSAPVLFLMRSAALLGFQVLPEWAPIISAISLLGFGWFMLYRSRLLRLSEINAISHAAVTRSACNAGSRIIGGGLGLGLYGLFIAEIVSAWAALLILWKRAGRILSDKVYRPSMSKIGLVAKKYKKYPMFEMPSVVVDQLAIALPVPIVAMLYGAEAAGWFGLARLLYAIPNGQIGKTAGDVFHMEYGRLIRECRAKEGKRLFYKFTVGLFFISFVPLLVAVYIVPEIVPFVFGEEWQLMGEIVALMSPWMFMALIVSSLSRALSVLQKQQWKLIYDTTALGAVIASYYYALAGNKELLEFIPALSITMALTYVVYFCVIALAVRRSVTDAR